ncbi:MAG: hypothetical protein CMJ25_10655 [Phycisphaerae bacterium]|nr:hypothetical protein [Phycisphaerae bacterium]
MAATLEVNYFSTFWLKKIKSITDIETVTVAANAGTTNIINLQVASDKIGAGQVVTNLTTAFAGTVTVVSVAANNQDITISSAQTVALNDQIKFTGVAPDANIPQDYSAVNADDWYIEEARIRGGYNNTSVDFGVKAYIVEDTFKQQHRISSLIYSGIFNSRTGINNTNQFSVGQDIVRSADPANGSIQKLYAEDTNLIIFQEDKVSRALIDKDAIYSAEGNASITSSLQVIGQIVAYAGEYGISTNPESFAVYGYRKYFTDKKRGCVLRLSADGITEISSYGMHDFFRDELANAARVVGGWNSHSKNYVVSTQQERNTGNIAQNGQNIANTGSNVTVTLNATIGDIAAGDNIYKYTTSGQITGEFYGTIVSVIQTSNPASFVANLTNPIPALQTIICWTEPFSTVTFDEGVLGWTSFSSYKPNYSFSLSNVFYTFNTGKLYQHYLGNYAQFYGFNYDSDVTIILNSNPSVVKNFKTINYEGALGWELESMVASSNDKTLPIGKYVFQDNLASLETQIWSNTFKKKEDKYFANLINNSPAVSGEILYGADMSGIKGFYSTVKMKLNNSLYPTTKKELFSVSSDVVESSY